MEDKKPTVATAPPEKSFQEKFRELTQRMEFFKECYVKSKCLIAQIEGVFQNDLNRTTPVSEFMTRDEKDQLDEFVTKKATVLVIGQTNSGKSSLINELLGHSYLPTAEVPCTSRIVRIRYSEKNVLNVTDWKGNVMVKATDFKKNIPRTEIALDDDSKRGDQEWARCIVEVGLNNPLLQGGHLEFVDAPGMSENEVLDSIVRDCTHGILQILIYVVDGNSSLRTQDREFLYYLKKSIGAVPIFFVCNKVDFNERAAKFDRDDDDDESYLDQENKLKIIKEKKMRIFSALVRSHIIERELDEVDNCDFFHGVSTREVRKARRKKHSADEVMDQYIVAFERMKQCFLSFASESITSHLSKAASILGKIQQRIFDFYISRQHGGPQKQDLQAMISKLQNVEQMSFEKMRTYVTENCEKIESIIAVHIDRKEEQILTEAEDMEFAPIAIADVVRRNEIINQYKGQIQKMVLLAALNISSKAAAKTVSIVSTNVRQQLQRSLEEASKNNGLAGRLVKQQLRHINTFMNAFNPQEYINMAVVKDYSLMSDFYKAVDTTKTFIADVISIVKGTTVNKEWKRKVAKNVLDNVDRNKVGQRIIGALLDNLHSDHQTFQMNLECITSLTEKAANQTKSQQEVISAYGPSFAEVLCLNDALLETLENPGIRLLSQIGRKGQRSTVYSCSIMTGKYSERPLVAKQFHENTSTLMHMAIQHAMKRFDEPQPNVLQPLSLVLVDNRMTLLLPKLETDLYTALNSGTLKELPLKAQLLILKQMADACAHCRERGLQLIDLRITNVLLDDRHQAFLDISKPRDDSIYYPDNFAPFHVYTEPPPLIHTSNQVLQIATKHDVYALGIMGWLLALGEYRRPNYANTGDIKEIYSAAKRKSIPDLTLLPYDAEREGFPGLLYDCLQDACSLWEVKETLNTTIEKMDSRPSETTL